METKAHAGNLGVLVHPFEYDDHIPNVNHTEFLLDFIKNHGNESACINLETRQELTFSEIDRTIRLVAAGFKSKYDIQIGQKVAVCLPNCLEYPLAILGVNLCGGVAILVNPAQTIAELRHVNALTNPDFWIATEDFLPKYRELYTEESARPIIIVGSNDTSEVSWNNVVESGKISEPVQSPQVDYRDQVALILFSSGTTGLPKGVALTHFNLVTCRRQTIEIESKFPRVPGTKSIVTLPLFHAMGLSVIFDNFMRGTYFILIPRFSLDVYLQTVQDYKIPVITVVPAIAIILAKQPVEKKYDLSSIRLIAFGSAPLGTDIMEKLMNKFNCLMLQAYGMTESTLRSHTNLVTHNRIGSIGVTAPFCQSKVVDPETGRVCGPNEPGEICVRGPMTMKGYYGNQSATNDTIDADGWLHTGDIGYYDQDGFFYITDRSKELIKFKGFQVSPSELEQVLLTHPDIVDAAVVGIADEESGELPRAFVVKRPNSLLSERQVASFVEGLVSSYKKLRGGVAFVGEIPRTKTGKILRRQLKQLVSKL